MTIETAATALCAVAIPVILVIYESARLQQEQTREEKEQP